MQVPVVDIAPLIADGGENAPEIVHTIGSACRDWGFFQVRHHGIPDELIARVLSETRRFFALPRFTKETLLRTAESPWGFYNRELTKQTRDMKEVFDFARESATAGSGGDASGASPPERNSWPDAAQLPDFRPTLLAYFEACELLARRLLRAICLSLGLPADRLEHHFTATHTAFMRLNYYPLNDPLGTGGRVTRAAHTGHLGVHHHTDAGALTVLLQDEVAGLQVFNDDAWITVDPVPDALLINIGDMVQVWSNDLYRAALHRVLPSTERARYSAPFFYNPSYETDYYPLETVVDEDNRPRYRTINWGEFRRSRAAGDYADYGTENQISDYRIA